MSSGGFIPTILGKAGSWHFEAPPLNGRLVAGVFGKSALQWSSLPRRSRLVETAQDRRHDYAHAFWGGPGAITGTVRIGAVAVRRRVRLYEAGSGVFIREAWSASDGSYSFTGLKTACLYTVTATDYDNSYNDVIAANLTPV